MSDLPFFLFQVVFIPCFAIRSDWTNSFVNWGNQKSCLIIIGGAGGNREKVPQSWEVSETGSIEDGKSDFPNTALSRKNIIGWISVKVQVKRRSDNLHQFKTDLINKFCDFT